MGARRQFADDYFHHPAFNDIRNRQKIYSDETRVCSHSDKKYVWRRRGEYPYGIFIPSAKFPEYSFMFWGAVGHGYKSKLFYIPHTLDTAGYELILREFFPHANQNLGVGEWAFMQDGASCHTTRIITELLCQNCYLFPSWPANSPDLNPIEGVWAHLKAQINWANIHTRAQAIAAIEQAWNDLDQSWIDALVDDFENRLRLTEAVQGQTIQPLISGHQTTVPEGYMAGAPPLDDFEQYRWDSDKEQQLTELRTEPANTTRQIARLMGKDELDVKHRARMQDIAALNETRWFPDPLPRDLQEVIDLGEDFFQLEEDFFQLEEAPAIPQDEPTQTFFDELDIPPEDLGWAIVDPANPLANDRFAQPPQDPWGQSNWSERHAGWGQEPFAQPGWPQVNGWN
jgi:hypothetical protein